MELKFVSIYKIHVKYKNLVHFSYNLENLELANQFIFNLGLKVCLEADSECEVQIVVLNNTLLTKLPCDMDTGFIETGISKISLMFFFVSTLILLIQKIFINIENYYSLPPV